MLIIKGLALHLIFSFNPTSCISCRGRPGSLVMDWNPLPAGSKVPKSRWREKLRTGTGPEQEMLHFTFCCVQWVVLRVGKPINKASGRLNGDGCCRRRGSGFLRQPPTLLAAVTSCRRQLTESRHLPDDGSNLVPRRGSLASPPSGFTLHCAAVRATVKGQADCV